MKFIKQYASGVIDFSSQYGGENPRSFSYSIGNIVGEPRIFPTYGDFTQAAVLRMYGPWWKPSSLPRKSPNTRPRSKNFYSTDYVDLLFDKAVYPWSIAIYETYNPGAVVRILALRQDFPTQAVMGTAVEEQPIPLPFEPGCTHWEVLWECSSPEENLPSSSNEARMFAPILREMRHPTRIIRLEFCSRHLQYYTELDAVELTGTSSYIPSSSVDPPLHMLDRLDISNKRRPPMLRAGCQDDTNNNLLKRLCCLPVKIPNASRGRSSTDVTKSAGKNGYFDLLPPELLRLIFSFLPLTDLCRCAMVCRLFHDLSYDPTQFAVIDLSSCWHVVNDDALASIVARCSVKGEESHEEDSGKPQVQVANLSWFAGGNIASKTTLISFVENCGSPLLTDLTLASSPAVTDEVLKQITRSCPNLVSLDIQSCDQPSSEGIRVLHELKQLVAINFYRTKVDDAGIICIIHSNPNLKHINLGSCQKIHDYDRVLTELSQHCPNLRSLDCWRARSLTSMGLNALSASCGLLEELDLGWCSTLQSSSGCFQLLAANSPHLTKLFLTANRTISDAEIDAFSRSLLKLEKLDILGTRLVTVPYIQRLLDSCKRLEFLDVSFCYAFTKDVVRGLTQTYPRVSFKRSFQEE